MKAFIVKVNLFKYGKFTGCFKFSEFVLINAIDKAIAKSISKSLTNSTQWAMDLTAYADLRTLKEVKDKQIFSRNYGLDEADLLIFSKLLH